MSNESDKTRAEKEDLLSGLERAIHTSVPLTPQQQDEIDELKSNIARLWNTGRHDDARRCFRRAIKIIEQGPPARE